jgi:signal transduction histidine kinase
MIFLLLSTYLVNNANANNRDNHQGKDLTPYIEFLEDPTHQLNIDDIKKSTHLPFQHWKKSGDINLGFTKSTYWFRFTLSKDSNDFNENKRLLIPFITLQHIALFAPNKEKMIAGTDYPIETRAWPHRYFVFPIQLTEKPQTYYLQIRTNTAMTVPLTIWDTEDFSIETQTTYLGLGIYYGGIIFLTIYNLLIFIYLREFSFFLYAIFSISMGVSMLFGNGIGQQYLWSYHLFGNWESQFTVGLYTLTLTTAIAFSRSFLQLQKQFPKLDLLLFTISIAGLIVFISSFITDAEWVSQGSALVIMIGAVLILFVGVLSQQKGNKSAKFFVLAWSILCIGAFMSGLRSFDLIPTNLLTANAVQITSAIEMLLLSFALAHRIRIEKEEKEKIQQQLLAALQRSETQLEHLVEKRTQALKYSLQNEQNTLAKFVRFGAYISHEFRNPLAIVKNQLATLQKERALNINDNIDKRLVAIYTATERVGNLFENWLHHDRLRQAPGILLITEIKAHDFLNKITQLCQNIYPSHTITFISQHHETINLYADEEMIRMAIINLVDNAVKYSAAGSPIMIHLLLEDNKIGIMVEDQGQGIDLSKNQNIFQDYFRIDTDKKTVKGVGLGLGLVSKVCEFHQGSMNVISELNKGSKFYLWLNQERIK